MGPNEAMVILFLQCPTWSSSQEAVLMSEESQCLSHPGAVEGWENSPTQENKTVDTNKLGVSWYTELPLIHGDAKSIIIHNGSWGMELSTQVKFLDN